MLIVNFFFWIMLLLLGLLTGVLVDANARAEKLALAELDRISRVTGRPHQLSASGRRYRRPGTADDGCRFDSDARLQAKRTLAGRHLADGKQLNAATTDGRSACFFTVGAMVVAGRDESSCKTAIDQTATFDFTLPHAAGYESMQHIKERTVLTDCPSCA